MLLCVDIGNSNIVFGVYNQAEWLKNWRIQTDQKKTADEYEVIFRSLLTSGKICRNGIKIIMLSSVVPSLVRPFEEMLAEIFTEASLNVLTPEIYKHLPIKILNPNQIGSDLVANAVAAYEKCGNNTMVIDFGTALTFTTIGQDSQISGVAISPGLKTAVSALAANTAQLPQIHLSPPPSVLGENTTQAIQSGIVYGFSGLVDTIIERTETELQTKLNIIATGGLSSIIAPLTKNIKTVDPMLTLNGLVHIHSFIETD